MHHRPTLVIHGFLTRSFTNLPIHAVLRRRGVDTYDVPIPWMNTQDIERSSAVVAERAQQVLRETGAPRIDLVGVSMGGLIAMHFLRCRGGRELVRRTVTLGTPLRGTTAPSLFHPLLAFAPGAKQMLPGSAVLHAIATGPDAREDVISIFADGDSVVPAEAAQLPGVRSVRAPVGHYPLGHYELVVHPKNLAFFADQLLSP